MSATLDGATELDDHFSDSNEDQSHLSKTPQKSGQSPAHPFEQSDLSSTNGESSPDVGIVPDIDAEHGTQSNASVDEENARFSDLRVDWAQELMFQKSSKYGLLSEFPLEDSETTDIVTVHSIARTRWLSGNRGQQSYDPGISTSWISRLFEDSRMLHYHYDIEGSDDSNADIFNRGGIDREAQKLLDAVLAKRTERDKKDSRAPIVFVSHDIGGTIVKKALVIAALNPAKYDDVFGNTTVLFFLGCPHRGNAAVLEDFIDKLLHLHQCPVKSRYAEISSGLAHATQRINSEFLDTKMFHRASIINIYSRNLPSDQCNDIENLEQQPSLDSLFTVDGPYEYTNKVSGQHVDLGQEEDSIPFTALKTYIQNRPNFVKPIEAHVPIQRILLSQSSPLLHFLDEEPDSLPGGLLPWITKLDQFKQWQLATRPSLLHISCSSHDAKLLSRVLRDNMKGSDESKETLFYNFSVQHRTLNTFRDLLISLLCQRVGRKVKDLLWINVWKTFVMRNGWTTRDFNALVRACLLWPTHRSESVFIACPDACEDATRYELLGFLESLIGHSENPVKFVVLTEGRDERLETRLSSLSHSINLADFDNFSAAEVLAKSEIKDTEIVDKHVKWLLINKPALASFADKITDLLGTCGSDFGLAQTFVQWLAKSTLIGNTQKSFREILTSLVSITVQTLTDSIVESFGHKAVRARMIVSWIDLAFETPTLWEVAEALHISLRQGLNKPAFLDEIDLDEFQTDVTQFSGLIVSDGHELRRGIGYSQFTPANSTMAHGEMASICLRYLSCDEVHTRLQSLIEKNAYFDRTIPSRPRHSLVSYAVKYWKEHYRLAGSYKPKEQALHFFENPSLRNLWQQALWVLSNPITRVSKSYLSALPVASITGLTDLVAQHVEAQRGSPTFPVDVDLALVEAAYGEHTAVAQALLDATVHTHGGLSDAILAAAATGNEITLGCLIMAAVRLRGFSWPLGLFQGVALLGLFDTAKLLLTHNIPIPPPGDSYETSILHLAVRGGNAQVVKLLIDAGSNVDAGVVNGESVNTTPLHQASRHGNVDVIQILLAAGANIEARDTYQNTPLIWAVRTGMIQATETLLAAGADVDPWKIEPEKAEPIITSSREPDSPLIWAAEFGHTECARLLLDKGADVKVKKGGRSALWFATLNGHVEICRHLLEKGADVNESSEQYGTLIVELMDQADLDAGKAMDILRLLVKYGANVNAIDAYMDCRRNALSRATVANRKELIEVLLENGAQPDLGAYADCGVLPELGTDVAQTGLYTAVYHGYNEIAKILIERGCNIHLTGQDKASSLHAAYNNPELADLLLEKGADVNGVSNSGTVTHLAIRYSQKDVLKVLLKWKPNLEIEDYGMTALCLACQKRDSEMIELLLEHGANINHRTPDDEYPLKLCCQSNSADAVATILSFRPDLTMTDQGRNSILHDIDQFSPSVDIYKMLLGAGFDINAQNADGETPAMKAAEKGVMGILKLLLARGADTSLSSATHESLLHVAASTGNWEIFKAIIDAGATVHLTKPEGVRETLVYKAASGYRSSDRLQMIQYLIEEAKMPPDEHCPRTQFEYPLHAAASFGNDEIVEYLVEKGANIDASDIMGRTVLHIAAKQCGAGVVDLLLSKGAEPLKRTNIDMIPLHFAAAHEYRPEGLETLVEKLGKPQVQSQDDQNSAEGEETQMTTENQQALVDINFKDRDGWTALMWAAKTKYLNFDILELLFTYGADPWVQGDENWTPLKIFRFHEPMIGTFEQLEPKEKTRTRPDGTIEEWDDEIHQIEPGDYQPGYQCSYCMTTICGKRWHCLDCSFSYDLCFKCISSKDSLHTHVYSGHTFEAIGIELYVGPDESPEGDEGLETVGEEDEKRNSEDDLLQGDGETDDISKILQLDDENNTDSDGD